MTLIPQSGSAQTARLSILMCACTNTCTHTCLSGGGHTTIRQVFSFTCTLRELKQDPARPAPSEGGLLRGRWMMLPGIRPGTSHFITTENVSAGNQIDEREKKNACVLLVMLHMPMIRK